jgi:hypothetical protein
MLTECRDSFLLPQPKKETCGLRNGDYWMIEAGVDQQLAQLLGW